MIGWISGCMRFKKPFTNIKRKSSTSQFLFFTKVFFDTFVAWCFPFKNPAYVIFHDSPLKVAGQGLFSLKSLRAIELNSVNDLLKTVSCKYQGFNIGTYPNVVKKQRAVFGSCKLYGRKPQNSILTASYNGGLTPLKRLGWPRVKE